MAYVGQTSIKNVEHMENAIQYVSNPKKALHIQKEELEAALRTITTTDTRIGETATFLNCSANRTAYDFEMLRRAHGQDKGVIAHHYYQSFSPDDPITPEMAHKIGVEFASKAFAGYQIVVTTHTDRNHIHNHILVNSCHIETGAKWLSNKTSLRMLRAESDRLCKRYGLSVIDSESQSRAIDKTTYQLAMQGKSWKVQLCSDLDEAVKCCHSKQEFEAFMREHGYECRYTGNHITLKKEGEKKGIRVNTLAKQFGDKYTKDNLEAAMGYTYNEVELRETAAPHQRTKTKSKSNWERLTERTFAQQMNEPLPPRRPQGWYQSYVPPINRQLHRFPINRIGRKRSVLSALIEILLLFDRTNRRRRQQNHQAYQFRLEPPKPTPPTTHINYGTLPYRELTAMSGENYSVTVNAAHLLKLANRPLLYAACIDTIRETVTITVKMCDKEYLAKLLGMTEIQAKLDEQNRRTQNRRMFQAIKQKAAETGQEIRYRKVTPEQLAKLQEECQEISYIEKESVITISFLQEDEERIRSLLAPQKEKKPETETHRNNRIYAELKKEAAMNGSKLRYKANLSMEQIRALQAAGITLAYFPNPKTPDLFKIAYSEAAAQEIQNVLYADADHNGISDRIETKGDQPETENSKWRS